MRHKTGEEGSSNVQRHHVDDKRELVRALMARFSHVAGSNTGAMQCPICSKIINSTGLRQHANLHLGIYRYHCSYCGKGMSSITALKEHEGAVHTNTDAFHCEQCGDTFRRFMSLKEHREVPGACLGPPAPEGEVQ